MGNSYYITSNLDATVFDVEEPVINDIKLNKTDQYIVIDTQGNNGKAKGSRMRFDRIDISRNQKIVARFNNAHPSCHGDSKTIELSKGSKLNHVCNVEEVKRLSGLYRIGRKLFVIPMIPKVDPNSIVEWKKSLTEFTLHHRTYLTHLNPEHQLLNEQWPG